MAPQLSRQQRLYAVIVLVDAFTPEEAERRVRAVLQLAPAAGLGGPRVQAGSALITGDR